jgi:predicted Zn-dependent protease
VSGELAERVLDTVRSATGGRAEAEVIVGRTDMALTRFANSFIHQNVAESTTSMRLRLHLDGRTATGATTRIAGDGVESLVERTVAASRLLPLDPGWAGLSPPAPTLSSGNVDRAIVEVTPATRAAIVAAFVAAADGLETAGYCQTEHTTAWFANSAGQFVTGESTQAALDGIARTGTSDGSAHLVSNRLGDVDGAALGARAADKARRSADPVELPAGDYEVVLEPFPVADVLLGLAIYGFNGRAVNESRSFVKVGERQFDEAVTLIDDATAPEAIGIAFDGESAGSRSSRTASPWPSPTTGARPTRPARRRPATPSPAARPSARRRRISRWRRDRRASPSTISSRPWSGASS